MTRSSCQLSKNFTQMLCDASLDQNWRDFIYEQVVMNPHTIIAHVGKLPWIALLPNAAISPISSFPPAQTRLQLQPLGAIYHTWSSKVGGWVERVWVCVGGGGRLHSKTGMRILLVDFNDRLWMRRGQRP